MRFSQINVAMRGRFHWCMLRSLSNKAVFTQVYVVVLRPTWVFFFFLCAAFKKSWIQLYAEGGPTLKGSGPRCARAAPTVVRDQRETLKRTQRWWPGKAMKGKIHLALKKERKTHTHTHQGSLSFTYDESNFKCMTQTPPLLLPPPPPPRWPFDPTLILSPPRPHTPRPPSLFQCKYQRRNRAGGGGGRSGPWCVNAIQNTLCPTCKSETRRRTTWRPQVHMQACERPLHTRRACKPRSSLLKLCALCVWKPPKPAPQRDDLNN